MGRRTKGEGGLYQRHDHPTCPPLVVIGHDQDGNPITDRPKHSCRGRWVGTVEVIIDGKRKRKSVYGTTKAKAREKLNSELADKRSGTLVLATMTYSQWLDHWLDHVAARDLRPQTLRGYRSKVDQYIKPRLGRMRLTDIRPEHVRQLHDWMRAAGLAEASVRQTHAVVRKSLKDAVYDGKITASPAERVKAPKTTKERRVSLTPDQANRVLDAAGDDVRWWFAIHYGMRQGECLGLRWEDVDLERQVLTINQTLQTDTDGHLIFGPPKSASSRRTIPLLPKIEARLRLHWINQGQPTEGLVFTNASGGPVQPKADWVAWRGLLDAATQPPLAPLPLIALHAARNSAASLMEAAGIPDRLVAQILGHSQVQMTHGYQTADVERMRQALMQVQQLLELE